MAGRISPGAPEPLGATPTAGGVNVAVFSSSATAIDLCLFDGEDETRIRLPGRTGDVFHGHVDGVVAGARYGLRAHGPAAPDQGHRFNPAKLLVDPYAVALDGPFVLHPAMFDAPDDRTDSAAVMPKAVVTAPSPPLSQSPMVTPWERTVIYEAHVRGLTKLHPDVPELIRGTFAALAHPAVIAHLKALGVTTLELLPTSAWIDERHLGPLGLTNAWGYNPVVFGAPDPRLAPGGWAEIKAATTALAQAGIETILDVVFNHTGEGDALGPTLSLRGLDNSGFYRLQPGEPARYIDDSGTGDTLALDRPQGVRLVMEAMRTWVRRGGVAGFRFDLATVLARRPDGFDPGAPLLAAIDQDPELRGLKLIAEPWDCGLGGYQLGRFPGAWGEWNDRFRDTVRDFWRGGDASLGQMAARLSGSQDMLGAHHRPSRNINFVTAHDGFTLADLVAYETKHNAANGEDNRDGTGDNRSWNNGVEGPTDDPAIRARRLADQRALLATLMLARGAPMLSMGAELGHSQGGNNNAYAQDNAIGWIDWAKADAALTTFAGRLTQARRDHPALHADRFLTGQADDGPYPDVDWRRADGAPLTPTDWDDPRGQTLQMILTAQDNAGAMDRVAVILHRGDAAVEAILPGPRDGHAWSIAIDSADEARNGSLDQDALPLAARSVVLAVETATPNARAREADDALVHRLATQAGIAPQWWTVDGERREVTPQSQRALLAAMDLPAQTAAQAHDSLWRLAQGERRALPACLVRRTDEVIDIPVAGPARDLGGWLTLEDEAGAVQAVRIVDGMARPPPLTIGRHRLRLDDDPWTEGLLIVAPRTAFLPPRLADGGRAFGVSAQLYGVRRSGDQGIGDFTTLARLAQGAAAAGAVCIGLNPQHALFPGQRERASPYSPSDRRFIDPIYLDVPGLAQAPALSALPAVDYPAVWAAKSQGLEAGFAAFGGSADLDAFIQDGGEALADFAAFQAIAETRRGEPWMAWPQDLRSPKAAGVAAFAAAHADRVRYHQYLQWLCEQQLAGACRAGGLAVGFCRDLAIGAAPDGAEAWAGAGRLARGVSIGAPPDPFSRDGQVWGLPPPIPTAWQAEGYASFAELVRANMRHAGALRIDHILGLARLFWIPHGADGRDGAYVAYPLQDLLGVLALESVRAQCLVIGEDLGTVPDGLRGALSEAGVFSYKVLPFEQDDNIPRPPITYPAQALACVATHDLPPLAGWWTGADIDERAGLSMLTGPDLQAAQLERAADKAALLLALASAGLGSDWSVDGPMTPALAAAIHAYIASTPSQLAMAQIEDLAGESIAVNLPGTDGERPNWRRRIGIDVDDLWASQPARAILAAMAKGRT